jgi:hypothetical protein
VSDTLSLTLVTPQVLHAFLGLKTMDAFLLRARVTLPAWPRRALWAVLFAFPPFLGWRVAFGHLYFPSLLLTGTVAFVLLLRARHLSVLGFFLLVLALATCVNAGSYPQFANLLIFGLPILGLLAREMFSWGRREIVVFVGVVVGSLAFTLQEHLEILTHFTGLEAARQEGGRGLVFSYVTTGWRDWLGTLLWDRRSLSPERSLLVLSEVNYPLGPLFLLLLVGVWSPWRKYAQALLVSALVVALFASDVPPVSTVLLAAIPPLNFFRVPSRAIFPLLAVALPLCAAVFEWRLGKSGSSRAGGTYLLWPIWALGLFFLGPLAREIALWVGLAAILFWPRLSNQTLRTAMSLILAGFSVFSFHQRLPDYLPMGESEQKAAELRAAILRQDPELKNPLVRAQLDFFDEKFLGNTGRVLGISTLDGYWQPLRLYNELIHRTYHLPASGLALNFRLGRGEPGTEQLYDAYNVSRRIYFEDGAVKVERMGSGRNWARLLQLQHGNKPCASRTLLRREVTDPYFEAKFTVSPGENCALVISTNYSDVLVARDARSGRELTTFPAGSLLGILVEGDITEITLGARSVAPGWAWALAALGLGLLGISTWNYRKWMLPSA